MPSQSVKHQEARIRKVFSAAYARASLIADDLAAILQRFLKPGDVMPNFRQLQELVGDWLDEISNKLTESDQDLARGRKNLVQGRLELRSTGNSLRKELAEVRRFLDESFGKEASRGLLPERNPYRLDIGGLQMVGTQMVSLLRDEPRFASARSKSKAEGSRPTATGLASAVESRLAELKQIQDSLEPGRREVETRLELKNRELSDAIDAQRRARDLLYGIYRAAGYDYMADSLGVKTRRKAKADEPPGGEPMPAPTPTPPGKAAETEPEKAGDPIFLVEALVDSA